jgi:3',5'-cyclic-AMP phosphodiesterase
MRIAWLTDIHLNFLTESAIQDFVSDVRASNPDAILIGGDIGESHDNAELLYSMQKALNCPIYFVLGNHDYYLSSITEVRSAINEMAVDTKELTYLTFSGCVHLTASTILIGHDSWADGRFGDYENSDVMLNDYYYISDLKGIDKSKRLAVMQSLAQEAADHFRKYLAEAFDKVDKVILLTHVPPFREACLYLGKISDNYSLPHFSCKIVGDVLLEIMRAKPDKNLTVLCGHTHDKAEVNVLPNLKVIAGGAEYRSPEIQRIIEID